MAEAEASQNPEQELASVEILPVGRSADRCEGALVRVVRQARGDQPESALMAGLGPQQCRELAAKLLSVADMASNHQEMTFMAVTAKSMWAMPGQALIVRLVDGVPQFEFAVDPRKLVTPRRKLILPSNGHRA